MSALNFSDRLVMVAFALSVALGLLSFDSSRWQHLQTQVTSHHSNWVNPFRLGTSHYFQYLGLYLGLRTIYDKLMEITCRGLKLRQMKYSKLVPKLEQLEMVDFLYLSLNSVGEFIFVSHLFQLALTFCSVQDLRVGNTLGFYLVLIMLDDLFYLWLHLAMHKRRAYPYIHKHHHRQVQPFRGYYDANNTNPLEAIANYLSTAAAFGVTVMVMGVPHLLGVVSYLMVLSICNIMNHHAYDIGLYVPFEFRPYDHQVHHRFPTKNYARMTMIWDKLWGSYSAGPPRTD